MVDDDAEIIGHLAEVWEDGDLLAGSVPRKASHLKLAPRQSGLADDRAQSSDPQLLMVGHRNRSGPVGGHALHDNMTAALTYTREPVPLQDRARFLAR
jgi:hypothetical protein